MVGRTPWDGRCGKDTVPGPGMDTVGWILWDGRCGKDTTLPAPPRPAGPGPALTWSSAADSAPSAVPLSSWVSLPESMAAAGCPLSPRGRGEGSPRSSRSPSLPAPCPGAAPPPGPPFPASSPPLPRLFPPGLPAGGGFRSAAGSPRSAALPGAGRESHRALFCTWGIGDGCKWLFQKSVSTKCKARV